MLFKLETRLRRLVWRASNPIYGVFISSTVLSFFAMKAFASSYGPADTHRRRLEADGTYAKRRFAEVNDSGCRRRASAGRRRCRQPRAAALPPHLTIPFPRPLSLPPRPPDPLYRLPENPVGGHRLDGMSPQQHRGASLQHH
jgi:hypothetical protein